MDRDRRGCSGGLSGHPRLKNIQPVHPSSQLPGEPDISVYSLIFCALLPAAGTLGSGVQAGWKHPGLAHFYIREKQCAMRYRCTIAFVLSHSA
jgi:hypothetical protein